MNSEEQNNNDQHIALEMEKQNAIDSNSGKSNGVQTTQNLLGNNVNPGRAARGTTEKDDEYDERPTSVNPDKGIDEGLIPIQQPSEGPMLRRRFPVPHYNEEQPGYVEINGVLQPIPDVNAYQHKKTFAQGMMDLALLSANANQLRYVLETYRRHPYYYPSLIFISMSILFQVAVGVGLLLNSRYNIKNDQEICRANKINNYTIIGIFVVTVVNVFISAFGVADPLPN